MSALQSSRAYQLLKNTQPPPNCTWNTLVLIIHQLENDSAEGNDYARNLLEWIASYLEVAPKQKVG